MVKLTLHGVGLVGLSHLVNRHLGNVCVHDVLEPLEGIRREVAEYLVRFPHGKFDAPLYPNGADTEPASTCTWWSHFSLSLRRKLRA